MSWTETSHEVYAVIFAKHRTQLKAFSSYTDYDGNGYEWSSGRPEVTTEWGFENSETPLLRIEQSKQDKEQKNWDAKFYIYANNN